MFNALWGGYCQKPKKLFKILGIELFFIERYDSTSGNFTHESHPKKKKGETDSTILECQDDVYVRLGSWGPTFFNENCGEWVKLKFT